MKKLLFIVLLFSLKVSAQQIPYYDATGRSRTSGSGTSGQVLTNSGGGLMSWQTLSSGGVTSVFGRTGVVVAATNDYTFSQIGSTPTTIAGYGITDFNSLGDARWLPLAGGTLTGTVNSRTIQPSATLTYSLGGASNVYVVNYTQQVTNPSGNLSVVAGGANSIIYSSNSVTQERMYTTGNHVSQNGGTFTDGGYRYDIISPGTNGYFRSGDATITGLTASKPVFTDANKKLTSTGPGTSSQVILGDGTLGTYSGGGGSGVTRLISYITTVNATTSVADMYTYTIPSSTLSADGMLLDVSYEGDLGSLGTYQFEIFFAGTSIYSLASTALPGGIHTNLSIHFKAYRQSSSTVFCKGEITTALGASVNIQPISQVVSSVNFATTNIVKIQGASSTAGQLLLHAGDIVLYP